MSEVDQNLLSQLLGLDAEQKKGKPQGGSTTKAATIKAMHGVKLASALKGLNITSNFMWLVLFVGFFLWLFVVYWVRHHEPFASHVLGPGAAHSKTGYDDRRLIENMRDALPFKVSQNTGYVYVPGKPDISRFGRPVGAPAAPEPHGYMPPASAVASGSVVNHAFVPPPVPQYQHPQQHPQMHPQQMPFGCQQHAAVPYVPPPALTGAPQRTIGYGAAYMVPHQTPDGSRIKMIVNR
jgi:hypothetical protein